MSSTTFALHPVSYWRFTRYLRASALTKARGCARDVGNALTDPFGRPTCCRPPKRWDRTIRLLAVTRWGLGIRAPMVQEWPYWT